MRSIYVICIALAFFMLAGASVQGIIVVPEENDVPIWEIGDQWCMGYEDELTQDGFFDDMETEYFDVSKMVVSGNMGYYRALTVQDDNTKVTVGQTEYICYDVYYEEYIAMAAQMDIVMSMDFASMMEQYGTRQSEDDISEMLEDMRMDYKIEGYMWFDLALTGHIYFTVDELAIAKGSFDFVLNSDVDFLYDITYSGYFFEDLFEGDVRGGEEVPNEEQPTDPGTSDEVRMYFTLKQTITDWKASYDIIYNPPLDIFDFPIKDYESWDASSQMTIILNEFSGTISYDMMIDMPESAPETEKGDITLGEGLNFPVTIGPEWVEYSFRNIEQDTKILPDNTEITAYKIGPQYDWYWEDEYSDNALNNYWSPGSYVEMDIEDPSIIGTEDLGAGDQPNAIDTMARSENWYSFKNGNFISVELPGSDSEDPFSNGEEEDELEPQTYSEVKTFNEVTRDTIKADYEDYKASSKKSSDGEDASGLDMAFLILTIAIIVIVICILGIWARKRSRKRQWQQPPPGAPGGTQYQAPGDRMPQPQQPPTQPTPPPPQDYPPQPQQPQQPYYPPPQQQQPQQPYYPSPQQPPQQPYYPPPQQQNPPRNY